MKEVVIILSHADTSDKLEMLEKCVCEIKKQGYPIILSTHIQVPDNYYDLVDYIVYDKDNPLIPYSEFKDISSIHVWYQDDKISHSYPIEKNHSYAVMKLIKSSIGLAYSNGYEVVHFVNYDYVVNENVLKNHSSALEEYEMFSYYYDAFDSDRKHINTGLFSVRTQRFLEISNKINSMESFIKKGQPVFERFVYQYYVIENNMSIKHEAQESIFEEGNILNSKSTLKHVIDSCTHIYFTKDNRTGEYYVYLRPDTEKYITLLIKAKGETFVFNPLNFNNNLVQITDLITNGEKVEITIPEYGFYDSFDINTHHSTCEVYDYTIVTNINNLEIIQNGNVIDNITNNIKNDDKTFLEISNSFGSDKTTYHLYHKVYPQFIEHLRSEEFNMLEIGIQEGRSFKLWEEYFPCAKIYGMDIGVAFKNERGEAFLGDQSKKEDLEKITDSINGKCRFIIDDGSHIPEHQLKTFYYLFENLLDYGGIYIIEDIECSYWRPEAQLYNYETGHLNIIDYFTKLNHSVNSHYNLHINNLNIKSITFAPNCIIITKKIEQDIIDDNHSYRFNGCL
jgi:hypothetical protein